MCWVAEIATAKQKKLFDLKWPFIFSASLYSSPMLLPRRPWLHPALAPQEEVEVEEEVMEEG